MATKTPTVQHSRMTREQAREALTVLGIQIATHQLTCGQCHQAEAARKARATNWALWVRCEQHRAFLRTESAVRHRLMYLKANAVKKAATVAGMSPWQWQRECPQAYAQLAAQFGE